MDNFKERISEVLTGIVITWVDFEDFLNKQSRAPTKCGYIQALDNRQSG